MNPTDLKAFQAGLRIRPLFICVGCGKQSLGEIESVELPHIFSETDGWFGEATAAGNGLVVA